MLVELILFVLIAALLIYIVTKENFPGNVPKGPRRIPFIGCLDFVMNLSDMKRLRDEYGDIFMTKMGINYSVYLCNYKLVKEAFSSPHVTDRPNIPTFHFLSDGVAKGVLFTNGDHWTSIRRFLLRQLRDLGMGKSYMEDAIMDEANKLAKGFEKVSGKPSNIPKSVDIAVVNVVWQLVASKSYDHEDKTVQDFIDFQRRLGDDIAAIFLVDFFPILKYLPKFLRNLLFKEYVMDELKDLSQAFIKPVFDSHKENLDPDQPRDVIDHYLVELEEQKKNPNGPQFKSEVDLLCTIFDVFGAGFDTTSNTLRWLILYVTAYPEIQRKLHEEIDAAVDYDQEISLDHKDSLPYLEATIYETHRYCTLASAGLPHATSKEIQLDGYTIPKGAHVYALSALCHEDPNYWHDPEKFIPERFIDENGKFKPQKESFMPFGIGRRQCLGEALARMELYFFSAVLLKKFHFSPPDGCTIDLKPTNFPITHYPAEQDIVITPRIKSEE